MRTTCLMFCAFVGASIERTSAAHRHRVSSVLRVGVNDPETTMPWKRPDFCCMCGFPRNMCNDLEVLRVHDGKIARTIDALTLSKTDMWNSFE